MPSNETLQNSPFQFIANLADEIADIPPDSIISRTIYTDQHIKAVLFGFAAGQELSEHTASVPTLLHILSGDVRLTLGEKPFSAQPGTWVHMAADLPHSVFAKTQVHMLLVLIQAGR